MKKIVFFMTALLAMMVFVGCNDEPPINDVQYSKQYYVNHDAIVDGVNNPMYKIDWLYKIQYDFDTDAERYMYRAVLQFTAKGDSVKSILYYEDDPSAYYYSTANFYERQGVGWVKYSDGSPYKINGDDFVGNCLFSKHTRYKIETIIDEALEESNKYSYTYIKGVVTRDSPQPPPPIIDKIDTILNNANDIEVLSCYKIIRRNNYYKYEN